MTPKVSGEDSLVVPCQVLPVIVFCQFAGTSLWFAPNAVVSLISSFGTKEIGALTTIVQVGFIVGTLLLSVTKLPDKIHPSNIFLLSGLTGSALNLCCLISFNFPLWMVLRFLVGMTLSGVYPIGMKVASQWYYKSGLGRKMGYLIGALVVGTAFPWLLRSLVEAKEEDEDGNESAATKVLGVVSLISAFGAVCLKLFADPPAMKIEVASQISETADIKEIEIDENTLHDFALADIEVKPEVSEVRDQEKNVDPNTTKSNEKHRLFIQGNLTFWQELRFVWSSYEFRAACLGYFGHVWEVYGYWTFVPELIASFYEQSSSPPDLSQDLLSFVAIAIGCLGCASFGHWSDYAGSEIVAVVALSTSGFCCLLAPFYENFSNLVFICFLLLWGVSAPADSAQFSTLIAMRVPKQVMGTALTFSTCVGFALTVVSIQILTQLSSEMDIGLAMLIVLLPGPVIGVASTFYYSLCRHKSLNNLDA